ncbi:MAG: hypothetical protein ACI4RG_04395 [Huintestinicola sp.]
MQKAVRVIYDMSEDTRIRELARMREKALHDEATYLKEAMEKGIAQGREEGKNEGRTERENEIKIQLKAMGLSDNDIRRALGL